MRCFIALELNEEFKNEIKKIQELLRKKNLFNGKFTEIENLHLTLKFLGEIEDDKVEEVKKKLGEIKLESFIAEAGEIGVFSENFIKIIWIHLKGAEKLQKEIDKKLKSLFEPEARFMSHITIVRVKSVNDKKALLDYLESVKPKKVKFKVEKFSLMKSELFPEGPVYGALEEYSLAD